MEIDPGVIAAVDEVLTTTRAVRRRLDLDREVDDKVILECIDIAEQAPTGGNQTSRRWIVVRSADIKQRLAELYREVVGDRMIEASRRLAGTGDPRERAMASSAHLAEHLGDVPAIVIPVILGRHDGSGRPGLFDSVIQSGWSFCLALRARGLGTAWTSAGLAKAPEIKELLGIPEDVTEIAMFPVAWTKGTDFKRAKRLPAREIAFFDGYARTFERGPSDPVRIADGPGTVVETNIRADPAEVWGCVTDINLPADFSEEFIGAQWQHGCDGPGVRRPLRGPQPPSRPRRVGGLLRCGRVLRAERLWLVHQRGRQSRAPAGVSSWSRSWAAPGCASGGSSARDRQGSTASSRPAPIWSPASSPAASTSTGRTCSAWSTASKLASSRDPQAPELRRDQPRPRRRPRCRPMRTSVQITADSAPWPELVDFVVGAEALGCRRGVGGRGMGIRRRVAARIPRILHQQSEAGRVGAAGGGALRSDDRADGADAQ